MVESLIMTLASSVKLLVDSSRNGATRSHLGLASGLQPSSIPPLADTYHSSCAVHSAPPLTFPDVTECHRKVI